VGGTGEHAEADAWSEIKILHASDPQATDNFGNSIATSGDVIVAGADNEDGGTGDPFSNAGAAYVFQHTQASLWQEQVIAHASDAQMYDEFGSSLAVSGDVLVVGAYYEDGGAGDPLLNAGAAYVFQRMQSGADAWGEVTILRASDAQAGDFFGTSVAVSGDVIVVGAFSEDGGAGDPLLSAGVAYVFERQKSGADAWGEVKILRASDTQEDDQFGYSVAVSGDVIVVGAPNENGGAGNPAINAGAAYVFQRTQGGADNWGEVKILHASNAQAEDAFGWAVSVSGDIIVVGALLEDGGSGDPMTDAGAVYVFQRRQGGADNWGQAKILHASDAQTGDGFGTSVAVSGDVIVVGAPAEDGGAGDPVANAGAAYVFQRMQGGTDNWGEVKILRISDAQADDIFGNMVAVSGDFIVVSAPFKAGGTGNPDMGTVYVFQRMQNGIDNWGEVEILHASDAQAGDEFGWSVAISGDVIAVSAWSEDGGTGDPLPNTGTAYIFQQVTPPVRTFLPLTLN
jgi:hypothetical protein